MSDLVWGKCEGCGATLEFPEESSVGKCNYCGGQFLIVDPTEIHYHEEVNLHEHYGTAGKSFSQLKYLKVMLETDITSIRIDYLEKQTTASSLGVNWVVAISERKQWGIQIGLLSILFFIFHSWHSTFVPVGLLLIGIGLVIFYSNPQEEHDAYLVAKEDYDQFQLDYDDSLYEKEAKLEHIKNAMLELV
ncbi:hypothetical protein KAU43_01390 [candidate division WOR-3 bacterium]|nr:hypothetical protein [candidate division WOR-3 bacterium]